jgi:hypothetical protein
VYLTGVIQLTDSNGKHTGLEGTILRQLVGLVRTHRLTFLIDHDVQQVDEGAPSGVETRVRVQIEGLLVAGHKLADDRRHELATTCKLLNLGLLSNASWVHDDHVANRWGIRAINLDVMVTGGHRDRLHTGHRLLDQCDMRDQQAKHVQRVYGTWLVFVKILWKRIRNHIQVFIFYFFIFFYRRIFIR